MTPQDAIAKLVRWEPITTEELAELCAQFDAGEATATQMGAILTGLWMLGHSQEAW